MNSQNKAKIILIPIFQFLENHRESGPNTTSYINFSMVINEEQQRV